MVPASQQAYWYITIAYPISIAPAGAVYANGISRAHYILAGLLFAGRK